MKRTILTLVIAFAVLASAPAAVAAQDGNGPPEALPSPVPEFVSDVLGSVLEFVDGGLESLGETVSGLTPGGDAMPPDETGR